LLRLTMANFSSNAAVTEQRIEPIWKIVLL
jgi:hypothetical protein